MSYGGIPTSRERPGLAGTSDLRFGGGNILHQGNTTATQRAFKGKKTIFQFPLTIEDGKDLSEGHYVNFYVNEQDHSEMKFAPTQKQYN